MICPASCEHLRHRVHASHRQMRTHGLSVYKYPRLDSCSFFRLFSSGRAASNFRWQSQDGISSDPAYSWHRDVSPGTKRLQEAPIPRISSTKIFLVFLRRDFEHFLIRRLTTTVSSPYGRCHYIGRRVSYPFRFKTATSTWQSVSVFFLTTQSCPPAAAADQIFVRREISANLSTVARFSARLRTQRRTRTRA